jgi:hypothetical protein
MDDIAEHGLAAIGYKGIKGGGQMDEWLANIRTALEAGDNLQVIDHFKMSLAPEDIYVLHQKVTCSNSLLEQRFSTLPIASHSKLATHVWEGALMARWCPCDRNCTLETVWRY